MAYGFNDNKSKHKLGSELVWTNPNFNTSFDAQTVNINLSEYDYIQVEYKTRSSAGHGDVLINHNLAESGVKCLACINEEGTAFVAYARNVTVYTDKLIFEDAKIYRRFEGEDSFSTDNNSMIPYRIYGCYR